MCNSLGSVVVVLVLKEGLTREDSWRLANFVSQEVYGGENLEPRPATNPPPVPVQGPYGPGDPAGLTFRLNNSEDAMAFIEHVVQSGAVANFYMRGSGAVNIKGLERLEVY